MGGDEPQEGAADGSPFGRASDGTVLVVDDEPLVRAWVARVLEREQIPVVVATNAREALRLVVEDRVRPTVLLTDIEMPGMTGIELAARILAARPTIRVVMMTGDPERAATARDRPTIVETVLLKPLDISELLAAVRPDATSLVP